MNTTTMKHRLRTMTAAAMAAVAVLPVFPSVAQAASPKITPGDPIIVQNRDGTATTCTIGPYMSLGGGRYGALTAGHCGADGDPVYWVDPAGRYRLVSHLFKPVSKVASSGVSLDFALVPVDFSYVDPDIDGVQVFDLATLSDIREAQAEKSIKMCSIGKTSGYRCGTLRRVDSTAKWLVTDFRSDHGDSGGPVWVPTKSGAAVVGILYGGENATGNSLVTPIELPMEAYAARLTVNRV